MFKNSFTGFDFSAFRLHVDLGFLGIGNVVKSKEILLPHKARKKTPLSLSQKADNKALSQVRVVVENAIAKIKSFFVLRIENRMKYKSKLDDAFEICAELANFKTSKRLNFN